MKLAIVFEVPDEEGDVYADVVARMVRQHAFAAGERIEHWSFDLSMRPVAAFIADDDHVRDVVRAAVVDNVSASAPCGCCGTVEIEGIDDAVNAIIGIAGPPPGG